MINKQRRQQRYIWLFIGLCFCSLLNAQETTTIPVEPVVNPSTVPESKFLENKVSEKPKNPSVSQQGDGGDVYNFYFQKGDAPQKVEQGSAQKVESPEEGSTKKPPQEEESGFVPLKKEIPKETTTHLIGSLTAMSKSYGFGIGANFLTNKKIGLQSSVFFLDDDDSSNSDRTDLFSYTTTKNSKEVLGGTLAVSLNFQGDRFYFSPALGLMAVNVKNTEKKFTRRDLFDEEETASHSTAGGIFPYFGFQGLVRLGDHFGMGASIGIPTKTKFANFNINFAALF